MSNGGRVSGQPLGELLTLQRPLCVPAEPAVLTHEPFGALQIAVQLPVKPAHYLTDAAAPPFGSKYVPPWPTGRFATATGT